MNATRPAERSTSLLGSASPKLAFVDGAIDPAQWARYEPRMRRVIAHVYDHLDEPLDLNALSEVACLSPHHWHRIYHAMYAETLAQTVKRLRLHRAASELANTTVGQVPAARQASSSARYGARG